MDFKIETAKIVISSFVATLAGITGNSLINRLLILLLFLMLFDTVLGWIKAVKFKEWISNKARWGSVGKLIQLGFVGAAYTLDWVFQIDALKYAFAAYFCLVEAGSIFENAYYLGVDIPREWVDFANKSKQYAGWLLIERIKTVLTASSKADVKEIENIEDKVKRQKQSGGEDKEDKGL